MYLKAASTASIGLIKVSKRSQRILNTAQELPRALMVSKKKTQQKGKKTQQKGEKNLTKGRKKLNKMEKKTQQKGEKNSTTGRIKLNKGAKNRYLEALGLATSA